MSLLFSRLQETSPLSASSVALLEDAWKVIDVPKGQFVLQEGTVCDHFYYLEKGAIRIFYYKGKREITEWLALDDSFFMSIASFFRRIPSQLNIETLEPSRIHIIHYDDLEALSNQHLDISRLWRIQITRSLIVSQKSMDSIKFETAEQRYDRLMEERPRIIQRVPLGHIASFLGISQETLSRIRGRG